MRIEGSRPAQLWLDSFRRLQAFCMPSYPTGGSSVISIFHETSAILKMWGFLDPICDQNKGEVSSS